MKRTHLIVPGFAALGIVISCAQDDLTNDSVGGTGATGGASASGGSAGAAAPGAGTGGSATGATGGTGGTASGTGGTGGSVGGSTTGGSAGTGVMAGSGGSVPIGGMAGTATAVGGDAGVSTGVGGSAGMSAGGGAGMSAGGTAGDGAGGSAGSGMAGSGTAGTGSNPLDPAVIVPDLDGFYWEGTCKVGAENHNCFISPTSNCQSGTDFYSTGINVTKSIKVHGSAGQKYTLNIEIRGVAGGRCYTGGTPGMTTGVDLYQNTNNGWYAGGKQANDSIWNTYEIHVEEPAVDGAPNVYFANSVQPIANPDAFPSGTGNNCQMEMTIGYSYTASFPVMGDSTIRFLIHDSNCKGQQNCGHHGPGDNACEPRTVSLTGMSPAPTFTQPVTNTVGTDDLHPQWLYFDVKSITSP